MCIHRHVTCSNHIGKISWHQVRDKTSHKMRIRINDWPYQGYNQKKKQLILTRVVLRGFGSGGSQTRKCNVETLAQLDLLWRLDIQLGISPPQAWCSNLRCYSHGMFRGTTPQDVWVHRLCKTTGEGKQASKQWSTWKDSWTKVAHWSSRLLEFLMVANGEQTDECWKKNHWSERVSPTVWMSNSTSLPARSTRRVATDH